MCEVLVCLPLLGQGLVMPPGQKALSQAHIPQSKDDTKIAPRTLDEWSDAYIDQVGELTHNKSTYKRQ